MTRMLGALQTSRLGLVLLWLGACGGADQSVDAASADAAVPDASPPPIDGPPPPPGTNCAYPLDVPPGTVHEGNTTTFGGERSASCSGGAAGAPDVSYRIDVGEVPVDLVIDGEVDESADMPFDLVLSARSVCEEIETELGCMDTGKGEHLELLGVSGQIAVLVDGTSQYGGQAAGQYTLRTRVRPILEPDGLCDALSDAARCPSGTRCAEGICTQDSPDLACREAVDITAQLLAGPVDLVRWTRPYHADHFQAGCAYDPAAGTPEDIYRFELGQPATLSATTDTGDTRFDTVLYVRRGACDGEELACNDDVDTAADRFHSTLTAPMLPAGVYYLIVDGASEFGIGKYRLQVSLQ